MEGKSSRNVAGKAVIASPASDASHLGLTRASRLVHRAEYDAVYRDGRRKASSEFTVFLRLNGLEFSRFGWSIKKTLGNAVQRNRIRRRLREILRLHRQEIAPGWDIVIHPRSSVATAKFVLLKDELLRLLPRAERASIRGTN